MASQTVSRRDHATDSTDSKNNIDLTTLDHVEVGHRKPGNGLAKHDVQPRTAEEERVEKRFVRKIDFFILPLLASMYFLASLDRGDVGNAATLGMVHELHLTPHQLSTCISIFYVGYIVFQLPGYLFLRTISPPVQIGLALMFWGTFNTVICVAKSYSAVAGLRVGVGAGEAILQAGPLYLSFWYRREELATRGAIFFGMSAVAGAFNGIIAYGIAKHLDGANGWAPWRWLFLIEGVISVVWGIVVLVLLPPLPDKLRWGFSKEEKVIAQQRALEGYNDPDAKIRPKDIFVIFKDRRLYLYIVLYSCINVTLASFSGFLPVILRSFGYSVLTTQALTIPIFFAGAASAIVVGVISDRLQRRAFVLLACFVVMAAGWLILLVSKSRKLSFAGCFIIAPGLYPTVTITQVWLNNNAPGFTRKAASLATMLMVAQVFSIVGTQVYSDPPHYYRGNGFALGATVLAGICVLLLYIDLKSQNSKKRRDTDSAAARALRPLGVEEVGNNHPDFYYLT